MRGGNIRGLELSDLHFVDLENEGPVERCLAVLYTLNQGKTNQVGRMEYTAFLRNKEADLCPVGGLAFYLFYRCVTYGSTPQNAAFYVLMPLSQISHGEGASRSE